MDKARRLAREQGGEEMAAGSCAGNDLPSAESLWQFRRFAARKPGKTERIRAVSLERPGG
jgi:hypothetical protein